MINIPSKKSSLGILFNRLYKWKWGFLTVSLSIGVLVFLLGITTYQYTWLDSLGFGVIEGLMVTGAIFGVKRYGWNGFIAKVLEHSIKTLMEIAKIAFIPFQIIWDVFLAKTVRFVLIPFRFLWHILFEVPKWFLAKRIPELLPFALRPLYKFSWRILLAGVAYVACWVVYSVNRAPKDFFDITLFGQQYNITITGACAVGLILGIPLLEVITTYLGMFWSWIGTVKWGVKFSIHW